MGMLISSHSCCCINAVEAFAPVIHVLPRERSCLQFDLGYLEKKKKKKPAYLPSLPHRESPDDVNASCSDFISIHRKTRKSS